MRKFLHIGIAYLAIFITSETASAAPNAHHTYTKPTITFSPAAFTLSYGQTGTICATVTPSRMASKIAWVNSNNAPGVFTITPGTSSGCGAGVALTITSNQTVCTSTGSVRAVLNGKTVASAQGTVQLPDKVSATVYQNPGCPGGYGALKIYFVHFATNEGGTPNFNGLSAHENLDTSGQPNDCGFDTSHPQGWTIGESPAPSNAVDDANGQCGSDPITCTTVINQTFTIGSCTTPLDTITLNLVNGVGTVVRSDSGGQ